MTNEIRSASYQRIAAACAFLFAVGMFSPGSWAATLWLVSFTIDSAPSTSAPYAVSSDSEPADDYKDYRLGSGEQSDPNFCVDADATRSLFIRFNRKMDGDSGVQRCDTPDEYGEGVQRQYLLEIRNNSACAELGADGYLPDANSWGAPCVITGGVNPRIRMGNLFGKNARFPVDFLTTNPTQDRSTSISYEIQSLSNATITAGPGDVNIIRTVSYAGMATLVRFSPFGEKPRTVADPFPLPFKMTFVRYDR